MGSKNVFLQKSSKPICGNCKASSRPNSPNYVPKLDPCIAGEYYGGPKWRTLKYFCFNCASEFYDMLEEGQKRLGCEVNLQYRSGCGAPDWVFNEWAARKEAANDSRAD